MHIAAFLTLNFLIVFSAAYGCAVPDGLQKSIEQEADASRIRKKIRDMSPSQCKLLQTLGTWKALDERRDITFEEVAQFYQKYPDWPNQIALRRRAEAVIDDTTSKQVLRAWFEKYPPLTSNGLMWFARVMPLHQARTQPKNSLIQTLKHAFLNLALSEDDLVELKTLTQGILTSTDYDMRFDQRMRNNDADGAKILLSFLSPSYKPIAQARLALYKAAQSGQSNIKKASYTAPGYIWQYGVYLLKTQQNKQLKAFLQDPQVKHIEAQNPDLWWTSIRRIFTRRLLEQGHPKDALGASYTPAKTGASYSESLWLRGWIQLTFLNDRSAARRDFEMLYKAGSHHANLTKVAYWIARTYSSQDKKMRTPWLKRAAENPADFYGQLAIKELGRKLSKKNFPVYAKGNALLTLNHIKLMPVVHILNQIGLPKMANLFFWKIALQIQNTKEHQALIELAFKMGGAYPATQVTNIASHIKIPLMDASYPRIPSAQLPATQDIFGIRMKAFVHAIIRQESRFDANATSTRDARGMMQVVDPTAQDMSRKYGIPYQNLYNVKDNIKIGQQYIKELLKRYNGSIVLAIAAYNAGLGRVDQWIKQIGYPGSSPDKKGKKLDTVDWIQMIPFRETRFYIEHVLENYGCYVALLGET